MSNLVRDLTADEVEFTLECLEENTPVAGNVLASGNDNQDLMAEQWVYDQLNNCNQWAWCSVRVIARWNGFEGRYYLGCCSYKSEEDFKEGGYYEDMKQAALDDLNANIADAANRLSKLS